MDDDKGFSRAQKAGACVLAVGLMVLAGMWAAPSGEQSPLDRVFYWSFVVFAVGLAELFILLVVLAILGRIDLTMVFRDKEHLPRTINPTRLEGLRQATVSLSRLQAFLWTLVVMTVFFHAAATHPGDGIPTIPPEILLVMGISGSVYLAGKHLNVQSVAAGDTKPQPAPAPEPAPPPKGGDA